MDSFAGNEAVTTGCKSDVEQSYPSTKSLQHFNPYYTRPTRIKDECVKQLLRFLLSFFALFSLFALSSSSSSVSLHWISAIEAIYILQI